MAPIVASMHHHRSTTKSDNKPFKSKHATKSALKDKAKGKVEREDRGQRGTPHQQVMTKLMRKNQAKQLRVQHKEKLDHEAAIFQGTSGAPKHIAVVPLSRDIDVRSVVQRLNESCDVLNSTQEDGLIRVRVERFKRNLLYMPTNTTLLEALDSCKLADWVVFLLTSDQQIEDEEDMLIRSLESQGITNVAAVVTDKEEKVPANKRTRHLTELKSGLNRYFPALDKISALENKSDCANLIRSLCTASPKGIRWRDDRSWMLLDSVAWDASSDGSAIRNPVLTGITRGKGLSPDRLVHVPGWGEYKIRSITQIQNQGHKRKANEMAVEEPVKQWTPSDNRDSTEELAPEESQMQETTSTIANGSKGVLLDDHHYFSDDNSHIPSAPRKLPKGTSNYQAAWYLEDMSDSDSDILEDEDMKLAAAMEETQLGPEDGYVVDAADAMTDAGGTVYPESEMHVDADADEESRQLEEFRASRKTEAEEDLEFPDEIELPPNVLARERLAKYRGLKSLRTSEWNTEEDKLYEPTYYPRLLQVPDYRKSYSAAIKETFANGVPAGTKVAIELEGVPSSFEQQSPPTSLFSLLRHERKYAVVNLNMTLSSDITEPVRAKEELIVQIGHRRFEINPIFSAAGQTPNDVHKSDRFLHPGRTAIATFTGPLTWGSVPVLVFRKTHHPSPPTNDDTTTAPPPIDSSKPSSSIPPSTLQLIGTATTLPPSSTRVIAKRIILTGHPYKIHKKLVTVRYMFFNREDVAWFSALPLWTKRGRQGWIKEPLGTHGYFKATFDGAGKVNAMDAIGVSLYKRVWPRSARRVA